MRSVVPAEEDPNRGRNDRAASGAGDRRRALEVHHRSDAADTEDPGSAAGVMGAHPAAWSGAASADLRQRSRYREPRQARRGSDVVHGNSGDQDRSTAPLLPGIERDGLTTKPVLQDLVHACRTFAPPADFNTRFTAWLETANRRVVRTIKAAPVDLIGRDRAAMLSLPPVPLQLGWRERVRLGGTTTFVWTPATILRRPDSDRPDDRCHRRP